MCEGIGHHVNIHARFQRIGGRLRDIGGHAMRDEFGNCGIVADIDTVKAPLCPRDIGQ